MCGFAGILGGSRVGEEYLRPMREAIAHRGPDDTGEWSDAEAGVGLAFARLAILDLTCAGHQPMISASGRFVLAFNGEIYNHLEMRRELSAEWRGGSDTETLLAGFEASGIEATIKRTVGMFAFAAWDKRERVLTLGRDRLGEKPLYYGWQGDSLLFGSELKALRAHPAFAADIDRDALAAYMRYGYIPAPQSIYGGIRKLVPGTLLTVRPGNGTGATPVPYWSLEEAARRGVSAAFSGSDAEAVAELEARLSQAVALQQIADVPLGAFLSGGVDSSTIVALMQAQSSRPVHTFTIGFEERQFNEAVHAAAVARHLGTHHTELYVSPAEARAVIPRLPALYDEPFSDSSQIPTFLVSELARRHVTVSLSGDAGDELFGGYNRYTWTRRSRMVARPLRRVLAAGLTALSAAKWDRLHEAVTPILPLALRVRMPGDKAHRLAQVWGMDSEAAVYERLVSIWPNEHKVLVPGGRDTTDLSARWEELADLGSNENRMMALDALTYLPDDILCKVDRAAMGVSLETRVPFLDHRVVELAWRLPLRMKIRNGQSKWIVRQLLYKHVPRGLIERPKMGFGVPIGDWLRGPLRAWAEDLLDESRLAREGYLSPAPIRDRWREHLSGRRNWQYQLWTVLMFQAWLAAQRNRSETIPA